MKTRLYAQLSFAFARELKQSGFPAPIPAAGQMWFSMNGQEHLICENKETSTLETYNTDACRFVPFGGKVTDGMVYCPNVQEAADFLNGKYSNHGTRL